MKLYNQLSQNEINTIEHPYNVQKKSISKIAKKLNRSKSTISREIKKIKAIFVFICLIMEILNIDKAKTQIYVY